jgi:carbonic anhydrase/acetyltransferase-like protein (isoleucine patch superfamily)
MKYSLGSSHVTCRGDCWIADNATVVGNVTLENNASIWFNCVVRGDNDAITIGENSQLQDGCILHVDTGFPITLGKGVSIGHMTMLHGCTIGDGTLIGIKSVILNGAEIGRNCLVGANSLITEGRKIPDGSLVLGSPARVVRPLTEDEIRLYNSYADEYVARWKQYRSELKADPQT